VRIDPHDSGQLFCVLHNEFVSGRIAGVLSIGKVLMIYKYNGATCLTFGKCIDRCVTNFLLMVPMRKFWRSITVWQRCRREYCWLRVFLQSSACRTHSTCHLLRSYFSQSIGSAQKYSCREYGMNSYLVIHGSDFRILQYCLSCPNGNSKLQSAENKPICSVDD